MHGRNAHAKSEKRNVQRLTLNAQGNLLCEFRVLLWEFSMPHRLQPINGWQMRNWRVIG